MAQMGYLYHLKVYRASGRYRAALGVEELGGFRV